MDVAIEMVSHCFCRHELQIEKVFCIDLRAQYTIVRLRVQKRTIVLSPDKNRRLRVGRFNNVKI